MARKRTAPSPAVASSRLRRAFSASSAASRARSAPSPAVSSNMWSPRRAVSGPERSRPGSVAGAASNLDLRSQLHHPVWRDLEVGGGRERAGGEQHEQTLLDHV